MVLSNYHLTHVMEKGWSEEAREPEEPTIIVNVEDPVDTSDGVSEEVSFCLVELFKVLVQYVMDKLRSKLKTV